MAVIGVEKAKWFIASEFAPVSGPILRYRPPSKFEFTGGAADVHPVAVEHMICVSDFDNVRGLESAGLSRPRPAALPKAMDGQARKQELS